MRKLILTSLAFLMLCNNPALAANHFHPRSFGMGLQAGMYGGYGGGIHLQMPTQAAYGYRNLPFDGRYGFAPKAPAPYMTTGNYFGLKDGDYLNPLSGSTGNSYNPVKPTGPIVQNPYMAPKGAAPTFQAVLGADGQYHVVPVQ